MGLRSTLTPLRETACYLTRQMYVDFTKGYQAMPTGTVKWFNNAKGYGFILPDEGGEDLFVHYTSILMDGYKTLKAGQTVSFDVVKGGKGLHATNIRTPETQHSAVSSADVDVDAEAEEEATEQAEESATPSASGSKLEAYS